MNDFTTWMQGNWYAIGNLLSQFAFLLAGVWFALKILKTIRALQEQFGALLKLSLLGGLDERLKQNALTERPTPYVLNEWPTAQTDAPALSLPEPEPRAKRLVAAWRSVIRWLRAPMNSQGLVPWRKILRWLQAPAGS